MVDTPYIGYILNILLFSGLSFFTLWIAKTYGFFALPYSKRADLLLPGRDLVILFAIYLLTTLFLAHTLVFIAYHLYAEMRPGMPLPLATLRSIQLLTVGVLVLCFFLYTRRVDAQRFKRIWKDHTLLPTRSFALDMALGFLTFFIAFPLVALIGECADMLLYAFFHVESYEQVAVRYLKMNLSSLEAMLVPLLMILIVAPVIEEFLFRGCLQTFLRKKVGFKKAILLSSLCFALFHFSPEQGLGNFSLLASLFSFALFLGFIYERQASLFASIALHMTFNGFSTIRILFFAD